MIKRQVLEGVQAVVKLNRLAQLSGKISLQVFDRSSGVENVNFNGKHAHALAIAFLLITQQSMKASKSTLPPTLSFIPSNHNLSGHQPLHNTQVTPRRLMLETPNTVSQMHRHIRRSLAQVRDSRTLQA